MSLSVINSCTSHGKTGEGCPSRVDLGGIRTSFTDFRSLLTELRCRHRGGKVGSKEFPFSFSVLPPPGPVLWSERARDVSYCSRGTCRPTLPCVLHHGGHCPPPLTPCCLHGSPGETIIGYKIKTEMRDRVIESAERLSGECILGPVLK